MKFVGIDLATRSNKIGICTLENDTASVHVGRRIKASEHPEWLVKCSVGADVVAVDVPFGWPKPFAEALMGYEVGAAFDLPREQYRLRATDFWVRDNFPPLQPKSVSTDKLGSTAIVGTNLLRALDDVGFRLSPRIRVSFPVVVEVYPAASLRAWGLRHQDFETSAALGRLQEMFDLTIHQADPAVPLGSRHCFDALVAALTAREYANNDTCDPPECISDETLKVEGWIRVPNRTVERAAPCPNNRGRYQ